MVQWSKNYIAVFVYATTLSWSHVSVMEFSLQLVSDLFVSVCVKVTVCSAWACVAIAVPASGVLHEIYTV